MSSRPTVSRLAFRLLAPGAAWLLLASAPALRVAAAEHEHGAHSASTGEAAIPRTLARLERLLPARAETAALHGHLKRAGVL